MRIERLESSEILAPGNNFPVFSLGIATKNHWRISLLETLITLEKLSKMHSATRVR